MARQLRQTRGRKGPRKTRKQGKRKGGKTRKRVMGKRRKRTMRKVRGGSAMNIGELENRAKGVGSDKEILEALIQLGTHLWMKMDDVERNSSKAKRAMELAERKYHEMGIENQDFHQYLSSEQGIDVLEELDEVNADVTYLPELDVAEPVAFKWSNEIEVKTPTKKRGRTNNMGNEQLIDRDGQPIVLDETSAQKLFKRLRTVSKNEKNVQAGEVVFTENGNEGGQVKFMETPGRNGKLRRIGMITGNGVVHVNNRD